MREGRADEMMTMDGREVIWCSASLAGLKAVKERLFGRNQRCVVKAGPGRRCLIAHASQRSLTNNVLAHSPALAPSQCGWGMVVVVVVEEGGGGVAGCVWGGGVDFSHLGMSRFTHQSYSKRQQ